MNETVSLPGLLRIIPLLVQDTAANTVILFLLFEVKRGKSSARLRSFSLDLDNQDHLLLFYQYSVWLFGYLNIQ